MDMNNCPNCGEPISEGSKFCTKCGAQLGDTTPIDTNIEYEWECKYDGDTWNHKEVNITGYEIDSKTGKSKVKYTVIGDDIE